MVGTLPKSKLQVQAGLFQATRLQFAHVSYFLYFIDKQTWVKEVRWYVPTIIVSKQVLLCVLNHCRSLPLKEVPVF